MNKCIVGKKLGMTQLFDENGKFIPVTVIEAGPCVAALITWISCTDHVADHTRIT